ncbi:hypothetical protein SVAN01_03842 [Stagonosporopsis vannaccii]|nr:hypothetical protein SVAN01_03842 [Stagonosporopsis vannaccii]
MPAFSHFYSATEEEAAACLVQFFPQQTESAPRFSNSNAEQLSRLLDCTIPSTPRIRNEFNQPLVRAKSRVESVEHLLNASTFSVAHRAVYRDKPVHYESNSDDSQVWQSRSRTPSSDDTSPQKCRLCTSNSSVKVEVSSASDGSEDGLAHVIEPTPQKHIRDWAPYADYSATHSQRVLQSMDTQFSKWSYDLHEGTTSIPFVMAQAPAETHEGLVAIDRKLWDTGAEMSAADAEEVQATSKALLGYVQQKASNSMRLNKITRTVKHDSSSRVDLTPKDDPTPKRATLIAKSKAKKDGSLMASKSVGQRWSALHRSKNRRSIMQSPPPTARKPELAQNLNSQADETKSTFLILNSEDDDHRRNVDTALQNRSIDFEDKSTLESLMKQLGKAKTATRKERLIEGVQLQESNEDRAEQTGRLKGKARRKAKVNAAPR